MSIFSWFNTSNLPQASLKKQLIDQGGHFLVAFAVFAILAFGIKAAISIPIILLAQIVWMAVLQFTKAGAEYGLVKKVLFFAVPFNIMMTLAVISAATSFPAIVAAAIGSFALGYGREIYQHGHFGISKGSAFDILFFIIGGILSSIVFFA